MVRHVDLVGTADIAEVAATAPRGVEERDVTSRPVARPQPGTGAAKAGLKAGTIRTTIAGEDYMMGGDIIVGAAGKPVGTTEGLPDLIATHKPGGKLTLEIYRGAKKLTVTVTLGRQPSAPPG